MSISPIDMQVMISKTTEVAGKHSAELHKAVSDQNQISQQESQRQEDNTKKVHDRNSVEKIYVDEKDESKKEKDRKKFEKNKVNNDEENEADEEFEKEFPKDLGRHFDASI